MLEPAKQTGVSKGNVRGICPSLEGGASPSSPAAYSPRTHLFYTSTNNLCMDYAAAHTTYLKGTPFVGVNSPYTAGPGGHLGSFMAWDAASGRKVWENKEPYPNWSGALVTAGDVVFYGTLDGWFKSVDARTGKLLSKFKVGSGVVGNPITYRAPDGRQYVAVYAGYRRGLGAARGRRALGRSDRCARAGGLSQGYRPPHEPGRHHLDLRLVRRAYATSIGPAGALPARFATALLACVALLACAPRSGPPPQPTRAALPAVRYEAHLAAGDLAPPGATLRNPHAGDEAVAKSGALLFTAMNCDGCHGGDGSGWVGPNLGGRTLALRRSGCRSFQFDLLRPPQGYAGLWRCAGH